MREKKHAALWIALFLFVLALALTAACGGQTPAEQQNPGGDDTVSREDAEEPKDETPSEAETDAGETEPGNDPVEEVPVADTAIHVRSTVELLDAIAPGAEIVIEPGYYNMTRESSAWDGDNEYVYLHDCYDGLEIVVQGVDGLTISGGSDDMADTELVIEPRYGTVLNFYSCQDITLDHLTLGHTDQGDCSGNVLFFSNSQGITLDNVDLYGCGVLGISLWNCLGNMEVTDSVIRDCAYGPLNIEDTTGDITLRDCVLTGSRGGGYYDMDEDVYLSFINCTFGEWESNVLYFHDDIYFENCTWSEITVYPDYGYDYDDEYDLTLDTSTFRVIPFDSEYLKDSYWIVYAYMDSESGEFFSTEYYAYMQLNADGTGIQEDHEGTYNIVWWVDSQYSAVVRDVDNDLEYGLTLYTSTEDDYGSVWMELSYEGYAIWLY